MQFARRLRDGIRAGEITSTVRVWQGPRVKSGGSYAMAGGWVMVDTIREITLADVTDDLARQSGFADVGDLLETARHGRGDTVYLIEFHFVGDAVAHLS